MGTHLKWLLTFLSRCLYRCFRKLWECWSFPVPLALFTLLSDLITRNSHSLDFSGGRWTPVHRVAHTPGYTHQALKKSLIHENDHPSFFHDGEGEGVREMPQYTILSSHEISVRSISNLLYPYVNWVMWCQASFGTSFVSPANIVLYLSLSCKNNYCLQIL